VLRRFVVDRNIWHFVWYGGVAGEGLRLGLYLGSPSKNVRSILSSLAIYGPGRSNALTSARATLVALQARLRRPHRAGQDGRVRRLRWPIPASGYRRGPSFAGLRPLRWLSRRPTTGEGVCSEQEHDYHGDSRGGDNRASYCATAVPSLRPQAGAFGVRPSRVRLERIHNQ
jgi:hypothetical protein